MMIRMKRVLRTIVTLLVVVCPLQLLLDRQLQQNLAVPTVTIQPVEHDLLMHQRVELICGGNKNDVSRTFGAEWSHLCEWKFLQSLLHHLHKGNDIFIVQIGAHVGFELNDPFANGAERLLFNLTQEEKRRVHWIFVEPSPPNYKRLVKNLQGRSDWCNLTSINAAVVPDGTISHAASMLFHSFSPDIDPETGYDSRSGKKLPAWITQVSGLSMASLLFNKGVFQRRGLNFSDYVVDTNVTAYAFSKLMEMATGGHVPHLVLIDTEGFDCNIILGISNSSNYLPPYLIFEERQCGVKRQPTFDYLGEMCYGVHAIPSTQNAIAVHSHNETCI